MEAVDSAVELVALLQGLLKLFFALLETKVAGESLQAKISSQYQDNTIATITNLKQVNPAEKERWELVMLILSI